MLQETLNDLKIYRAFYKEVNDGNSCIIIFLNDNDQICISSKELDVFRINGLVKFSIENGIYTINEMELTNNLIKYIDNILIEYSTINWLETKNQVIISLFNYLNNDYNLDLDIKQINKN